MTENRIETIALAAHEAQCERLARITRWVVVCWMLSVLMLGWVVLTVASYEETVSEITQDSQDNGSNYYAGGDLTYGYADNQDDDTQARTGGGQAD